MFGMKTTQVDCPFGLRADTKHMVGKKKKNQSTRMDIHKLSNSLVCRGLPCIGSINYKKNLLPMMVLWITSVLPF